jgi:hypothetical protein
MSRLIDEYTKNKSPEDKKEVERRVREMAGTMSELSALMLVLEEMRQEGKAGGGRIGYQEGTKPKINFDLDFAKSGKNQVTGAPEGITAEDQYLSAVVNLDLPITEKIGLLAEYAINKDRTRFEYDDSELQGGLFKGDSERKKIGLRYGNEGDQGITGSIMLDPDTKDYMAGIKFSKKFAKGGRMGLADGTKKFMTEEEGEKELPGLFFGEVRDYQNLMKEAKAQQRDEAKVKRPKKQKPLKIDLEKIKKLIQKAKAREGAADGGIGYLLGE